VDSARDYEVVEGIENLSAAYEELAEGPPAAAEKNDSNELPAETV